MTFEEQVLLVRRSKMVHTRWYLATYPDVAALGMNPVEHFLKYGGLLGRNPGRAFDTRFYLATYPDAAASGLNPLVHYLLHGEAEGRLPRPERAPAPSGAPSDAAPAAPPPDLHPVEAIRRAAPGPDAVAALRRAYAAAGLGRVPDRFALVRVVGNDLEPRHRKGQSRANLRFVLENEPPLADCEKRWVINRIADPEEEARILALLDAHGQGYVRLPFVAADYARIGWDTESFPEPGFLARRGFLDLDPDARDRAVLATYRLKNAYVMNNNGGRNAALADGRARAKWTLPWDGNCFVTAGAWEEIRAAVAAEPWLLHFVTPMARMLDNADLLRADFRPDPVEEPQLVFRRDTTEVFDAAFVYGRRPKVEMFWRLGVPGAWDRWKDSPWDPLRAPRSPEAGRFGLAGWVARLFSGVEALEKGDKGSFLNRGAARRAAIRATIDRLDAGLANPFADPGGLICYATPAIAALKAGLAQGGGSDGGPGARLAARIVADADAALGRGPYSVTHKTTLPPSGDPHDYWHPAPYWWPNPDTPDGLPYVVRDGERVPGTELHEPGSEQFDRTRLQGLFDDAVALALGWALTGRAAFAEHAARLLRTWFVDPATRMTPHLRYAQVRRGRDGDENPGTGIVEFKDVQQLLDAARLAERAGAFGPADVAAFRGWLEAYLDWLLTSAPGRRELLAANNHGTFFDLQVAAIAAWLGKPDLVRETLVRAQSRLARQIAETGEQPEEMTRTATAHYCLFNLQAWLGVARIGMRAGVLRPDFAAEPWSRLPRAIAWVLERDLAAWPYPQITPVDPARAAPLAAQAAALGAADLGPGAAGLQDPLGAKPVFDPHDAVPPYWALTLPDPAAAVPRTTPPAGTVRAPAPPAPVSPAAPAPPVSTPPVSTPPVSTPPVSTPPVSTPPVSTPPVSTPPAPVSPPPPPAVPPAAGDGDCGAGDLLARLKAATSGMQSLAVYDAYRGIARDGAGAVFDVGCGQGGSTIAFALGLRDAGRPDRRAYAFDQFFQQVSGPHPYNLRDNPHDAAEKNLAAFRANLATFGVADLVQVIPGLLTGDGLGPAFDGIEVGVLCLDTDGYIDRDFALFFDRVAPGGTVIVDDYADRVNRHGRKTLAMARGLAEDERAAFVARLEDDHLRGGGRLLGKHLLTWRLARLFVDAGLVEETRRIDSTLFLRKTTARPFAAAGLAGPVAAVKAGIRDEFLARAGAEA